MNITKEQLLSMQNENGHYSEPDVKAIEQLTGRNWKDVHKEVMESQPDVAEGDPRDWSRAKKLKFIEDHKPNGREAYKQLIDERT